MRKLFVRVLGLSLLGALALALLRRGAASRAGGSVAWEPQPFPAPPRPMPAEPAGRPAPIALVPAAWVEPTEGACPVSHPIKAKVGSGIFHSPGGSSYERTRADRCYRDADAAIADGLRAAKR